MRCPAGRTRRRRCPHWRRAALETRTAHYVLGRSRHGIYSDHRQFLWCVGIAGMCNFDVEDIFAHDLPALYLHLVGIAIYGFELIFLGLPKNP